MTCYSPVSFISLQHLRRKVQTCAQGADFRVIGTVHVITTIWIMRRYVAREMACGDYKVTRNI